MVRNIDLVEALIFYGDDAVVERGEGAVGETDSLDCKLSLLGGVENLLEECRRDQTAVIAILQKSATVRAVGSYMNKHHPIVQIRSETQSPPNPQDLWTVCNDVIIQPKGFGGSSGFGSKAPDPERPPLPKHCVVLCTTQNQCRAARYAGMRVICLNDNPLADAVLDWDWSSIGMDDIATPGSFWLNPPHPKDDDGNRVDVDAIIESYQHKIHQRGEMAKMDVSGQSNSLDPSTFGLGSDDLSDSELEDILADMDPM